MMCQRDGLHAVVVVAAGRQAALLRLVGDDVDELASRTGTCPSLSVVRKLVPA